MQEAGVLFVVKQNTDVLVGTGRAGRRASAGAPQTVKQSLLGEGAGLSGFMLEHGLRQRRVRLLWSPLRVTEFGEGVTTAGGEWVCSQSASVSRQLSKVHQGCGAARPCGLTGVVWPRAWRAGDCGPPQNFGPSPGPEEIAAVHLAIGRAASEVRGRKASIRGVRQVTSFCGLRSATSRATERPAMASTAGGTSALASRRAAPCRRQASSSSSSKTRMCSLVAPDGPAAEPRRALRKPPRKACWGRGAGLSVRQRRVRLLCSPLWVTEFGEGVTTAGGEWVCSQSASVSRQLYKVHQGCGAARPCGLTGVVWPCRRLRRRPRAKVRPIARSGRDRSACPTLPYRDSGFAWRSVEQHPRCEAEKLPSVEFVRWPAGRRLRGQAPA